ncbi:Protein of unknown function [Cotesia congregata]|uniref:Uncharacterized protein n=1 Tax=Cotesia congregata TaxID=51543 RepID=A0A8J2H906_COTCN|nr:Protein of unknown function [Cotesia congregata]
MLAPICCVDKASLLRTWLTQLRLLFLSRMTCFNIQRIKKSGVLTSHLGLNSFIMWVMRATLCCCLFKIEIIKLSGIPSQLHRNARELAEMCFKNNSNPVIISADLLSNDWDPGGNSWVVFDHKFQKQATGFNSAYPTYVLSFESIGYLKAVINHFRRSTAWSIKSPFLIVERKSSCLNAREVLQFMWKQDLLAVFYLCSDQDTTIVFTLNLFAAYAPAPWFSFDKFSDNGKILTLYSMKYTKDSTICRNIAFDKSKKLNGHEPRTTHGFFPSSVQTASFKNGYFRQLAETPIDVLDKSFQLADTNYKYMDILTRYDVITYSILTKKSNYLTTISQVACNYQFLFLTIIMLMLIGMIIIINNKFDISSGILDVMSLTAGMGVITPLDRLSMRIIYIAGFLFVFTVMPEFQGQVSAILYSELGRCAVEAEFNSTVACISQKRFQQLYASKSTNLHLSKDVIFEKCFVNWVRKDWSLKDKLDRVSSWTVESGFYSGQISQEIEYFTKKLREAKRIEERASFEFIDFDTLILSYMIVLGLSIWGLVAFGLELLFHKYEKRRRQTLIRRRHRMELKSQLRNVSSIEQIIPSNPGTSFEG